MVKIFATLNNKEKRKQEIDCSTLEEFRLKIEQIFNIDEKSIKIMRPPTKDEAAFQKHLQKPGLEIFFIGNQKKEQTTISQAEQIKMIQKIEQKIKEVENQKLDEHQKIIKELNEKKIKERDFSFMNENHQVENMGTDHYTSIVHLLRIVPEFRRFCEDYEVQPKNPDGLIIEELKTNFQEIEGKTGDLVNPLEFCSAFIAYCADDIEYPFPSYDYNYIINKIFDTIYNAYVTESQRKEPNSTLHSIGEGGSPFGISVNLEKTKITPLDEDDYEVGKLVKHNAIKYVLQCDLSDPSIKTFEAGIAKRFEEKNIWENFYAFDLEYKQKIENIEKPSKYVFVHINRVGYPPAKDQSEEIVLLPTAKSTHKVKTKRILDLSNLCSSSLNDKLQNGKFERYQLFYSFGDEEEFKTYRDAEKKKLEENGIDKDTIDEIIELKYMYFDKKLFEAEIFDEYYFQFPLKGSKQTGEFRLIGCIYHKGKYYHHPDQNHKKDNEFGHDMSECRGQFMVMVYKQGREWLKFHNGRVQRTDIEEATSQKYWGGGEWTPVLALYRQIYIKNIEIEYGD